MDLFDVSRRIKGRANMILRLSQIKTYKLVGLCLWKAIFQNAYLLEQLNDRNTK